MFTRAGRKEWVRIPLVTMLGVLLLVVFLMSLSSSSARAVGTFTVNTTLDNDVLDNYLSLREAILVSQGTLTTNLSEAEKAQLGGCIFSGSTIIGGCGAGIADTIVFGYDSGVITLGSALPNLANDNFTTITGPNNSTVEIAIDATNLSINTVPFRIYSDNNQISHLSFRNASADAIRVYGDQNTLAHLNIYGNGGYGILISGGDDNVINAVDFGFRRLDAFPACSAANRNGKSNIFLTNGAVENTIQSSSAGCSLEDGITITGTQTISNVVTDNYLGTYYKSGGLYHLSNSRDGVAVLGGSDANQIEYNVIGNNNQNGVRISGVGTDRNVIYDNDIGKLLLANIPNDQNGILIESDAKYTEILTNSVANSLAAGVVVNSTVNVGTLIQGNYVHDNDTSGVILGGNTSGNTLTGNAIYSNGASGIQLAGSANANVINTGAIHNNAGAGISQAATSGANWWSELSVYDNGGLGIDRNANGTPDGPYATITSCTPSARSILVSGHAETGGQLIVTSVELYVAAPDPTGYGEGKTWLGSAEVDVSGHWQMIISGVSGPLTAVEKRIAFFIPFASEFGPNFLCTVTDNYLPMIEK